MCVPFGDEKGEPLFCLVDVCRALEIDNASQVKQQVCEEFELPILKISSFDTGFGIKDLTMITEQQMYFVMLSRKPIAKQFKSKVKEIFC